MNHTMEPSLKCAFNSWKFRDRFELIEGVGNNVRVQCRLCLPTINILSTSKSSTSNLKKHLMRKHDHKSPKEDISSDELGLVIKEEPEENYSPPPKKQHLQQMYEPMGGKNTLDALLLEFIMEFDPSFNLVDNPTFIRLIETLSGGKSVMSKQNLVFHVENTFLEMRKNIRGLLQNVNNVSATVDMWSVRRNTYLCLSVHWVEESSLRRKSAALSVKKVEGPINSQNIYSLINRILLENQIKDKLTFLLTDFSSTVGPLFPEYDSEDEVYKGFKFLDAGSILSSRVKEESPPDLPAMQKCSYHTLNYIATNTVDNSAFKEDSSSLYKSVRSKVASIWHKEHNSLIRLEALQDLSSVKAYAPIVCRWIYEFAVLAKLSELGDDQLNEICNYLGVAKFLESELSFLREYVETCQPLAQAIDVLQGDKRCYYGYIIPTIISLKTKLTERLLHVKHCATLISGLIKALEEHFGDILASQSAKMATASLPKFRLCWVSSEEEKAAIRQEMNLEATLLISEVSQFSSSSVYSDGEDSDEDFFVFRDESGLDVSAPVSEVSRFLSDNARSIEYLHSTPIVKELFLKYNTAVPFCASHERFLNHEGKPLSNLHEKMPDEQMEWCLLLRYNKSFYSIQ